MEGWHYRVGPGASCPLPHPTPGLAGPHPAPFRTPDLAEAAGMATGAALGLGLSAHVFVSVPVGGSAAFIGAPRLHVNEALLDSRNPEGEEMRGGCTGKFPTSLCLTPSQSPGFSLTSRNPPFFQGAPLPLSQPIPRIPFIPTTS